jgi:SAM-dependent methyltransferase
MVATLDFMISSDVFEHVVPPLLPALKNVRSLLKPDGVLVLTVPWGPGKTVIEHFPDLYEWEIVSRGGSQLLRNVTRSGVVQEFDQLVFHGGPGLALEVRRFGDEGLFDMLRQAGFSRVTVHRADDLAHGAYWPEPWSQPVAARP